MNSAVRRQRLSALLLSAALAMTPALSGPALQTFVVDHEHRVASPLDVRFLLEDVAGQSGFIHIKDGHLYKGNGERFRCWGINMVGWTPGSALLPPKTSAETFAASLSKLGVNCVRLHFLDMRDTSIIRHGQGGAKPDGQPITEPVSQTPAGLIDSKRDDTREFNPEMLDRLDYMVYQLKQHGVYVDLNLNVGRSYKAGDGVPDAELIGVAKGFTYFSPELIALQKEYAKKLITHVNPYTKTSYADETSVAVVEIVNENSLTEFWMRNWLRGELEPGKPRLQLDMTPHFQALLTEKYNDWLKTARKPAQIEHLRKLAGVKPGQAIPITRRGDFRSAPKELFDTELAFLTHVETSFFDDFTRYLRNDLKVKVPVIDTGDHTFQISGLPLLRTTSKADIQDAHAYWQHPAIFAKRATSMLDAPERSMVVNLARTAMAGKPFTISEVNEPFPNEHSGEMIPILASYAAFQDWDGVFFYSMEPKINGEWQPVVGDYFDIAQDPVKIAQLPLGAMIFLRHDISPARQTIARTYSTNEINESARGSADLKPYFVPNFPVTLPLVHGSRIRCLDCAPLGKLPAPKGPDLVSDTGELRWHANGEKTGFLTAQGGRTEVLTGFTESLKRNNGTTPHLGIDIENAFATVALSALDGKPLSTSNRMMLIATAFSRNSGAEWDSRHSLMEKWGTAPTQIEPITGWIMLKDLDGALKVTVTPYDGAGKPLAPVEARQLYDGWEFPIGATPATNYLVSVTR